MKKNLFSTFFLLLILALTSWNAKAQTISELLPLDGLNFFVHTDSGTDGCTVSYDPGTQTVTYDYPDGANGWGYAGWDFREGELLDLSAFSSLVIHLTDIQINPPGTLEFSIKYATFGSDQKISKYSADASSITIVLDPNAKNEIEYVYIKSEKAGSLRIDKITASYEGQMDLSFSDFHTAWKGANTSFEYNEDIGLWLINFGGDGDYWQPWGWGNEGRNFSEYDYVRVDFAEAYDYDITLSVSYNPENVYPQNSSTWPAGSTFIAVPLNKDVPGQYVRPDNGELGGGIRDIVIRSQADRPSILLLDRAYVAKGEPPTPPEIPMADLIVTKVIWEPATPVDGEDLLFSATVKNIGTKATPDGVKHGVVFRVFDTEEVVVHHTWSDNYKSSIAPGEEVLIKMRNAAGEGSGKIWTYSTAGGPYFVQAEVNDTNDFPEISRNNNFSDFFEISDLSGIQSPSVQGNIYVENGVLKLTGYSPSAIVTVYNLQGQQQENVNLKNGIYIVKVIDNGYFSVHKVVSNK